MPDGASTATWVLPASLTFPRYMPRAGTAPLRPRTAAITGMHRGELSWPYGSRCGTRSEWPSARWRCWRWPAATSAPDYHRPALEIPPGLSRQRGHRRNRVAVRRLVAGIRFARTQRADRSGPAGELRPAGGHRPSPAGRRPGAHRRRRIAPQPRRQRQRELGAGEPGQRRPPGPQRDHATSTCTTTRPASTPPTSWISGASSPPRDRPRWRAPCSAGSTSRPSR